MTTATDRIAIAALALCLAAPVARAQSAEAEVLFREAKRLLKKGKIAEACDKLDGADRLEPTAGTELNLGDCREKNGQLATAWAVFVKATATAKHAGDTGRAGEAKRRAKALEPRLVHLTIHVPDEAKVDGLVIKRNDTAVDPALWDQRVPVDPDDYAIAAAAPGYQPWTTTVTVKLKARQVEVPVLAKLPPPPAPEVVAPPPVAVVAPTPAPEARAPGWSGRRKWSVAVGAIGVAAIGGGVALGLHARHEQRDSDQLCPMANCNNGDAIAFNHDARRDALLADLGYGAGGALVVTAVVLWLTGGASHTTVAVAPIAAPGVAGVAVAGGF